MSVSRGRRRLLAGTVSLGAAAALAPLLPGCTRLPPPPAGDASTVAPSVFDIASVQQAVQRLLPAHAAQIHLHAVARDNAGDRFRVEARAGDVHVHATSPATLLTGLHWYLKYGANAHISWAGSQTRLPTRLPAMQAPLERATSLAHRFALNDTDDGYSGPYRQWSDWERLIDTLALQGVNEVLVTVGQEAVYHRLLQDFGYDDAQARAWIPAQAHQPWWLLQNMSGFGGPVSRRQLDKRIALGQRIAARLRELGMAPVFPGYFGTVPVDFARRNPGVRTVPQGLWCGFQRPDWLDPREAIFERVAGAFYQHQSALFGKAAMFKMDLLHEGGKSGDVALPDAARAVQGALLKAHPGAIWVILGWQKNPQQALLSGVDRARMLILDGVGDRYDSVVDREADWLSTPYAFGTIPNFGGHTTLGANGDRWCDKFPAWRDKPGSALAGTALMPEGAYRDAAASELFGELAWRQNAPDLERWFADYAQLRYGGKDDHAAAAWRALADTAYRLRAKGFSEAHDSLFCARPSLQARTAASWSPEQIAYDPLRFQAALPELLAVNPALRDSDAYRYDLVDIARQCLSNAARLSLPALRHAYEQRDRAAFTRLCERWLAAMRLSERLLATHPAFMLGPWLEQARAWGEDDDERARFEYDARSILSTWGARVHADGSGLHDYANREWSGLMAGLYMKRWERYFEVLDDAFATTARPRPIDWFAMEDSWARARDRYPTTPQGDAVAIAREVSAMLGGAVAGIPN